MIKMNKIEILAPAGSFESLYSAVRSGADAVYLGGKQFSARTSAQNFDADELKMAVAYCHIHGVKVYLTINTLIFDDEFEQLRQAVVDAATADVDAVLVQNIGVARFIKSIVPDMPLHASTQMSVHTASGVKALYEMGFSRVVVSREMSKSELKKASEIPVELEVFVHGALCMSVSGQCYFSAMLGSRSGNRGACAQTCRLPFSVGNDKNGHALSLRDNSLINYIGELQEMGIASAKIEGRMKRPEYVSVAVKACVEQRDNGFVCKETAEALRGVFSRTGFTDGYYTNRLGKSMFGTRTKSDVVSADEKLLSAIRQGYKDEIKNIGIKAEFEAVVGKSPVLRVTDGVHSTEAVADVVCEKAINKPLDVERCKAQLEKTGGTAYYFESIEIKLDDEVSVPMSALNQLRRDCLSELDRLRSVVHNYKINDVKLPEHKPYVAQKGFATRARFVGTRLGEGLKECQLVYVPLFADLNEIKRLSNEGYKVGVEIPRGMFGREDAIDKQLDRVVELGVTDVLCSNIGALYLAKQKNMTLHGGFGLNLVNTYDMLWAEEYGLTDVELSFELTFERINRLGGSIDKGIISYGYLPLMLCRNCPNKSRGIECSTCKNQSKMTDRKGEKFYLRCDGICTEVLNCVPLFIAEQEYSSLAINFHILRFTVENYVENIENIRSFIPKSMLKDKMTRGLYRRGVN